MTTNNDVPNNTTPVATSDDTLPDEPRHGESKTTTKSAKPLKPGNTLRFLLLMLITAAIAHLVTAFNLAGEADNSAYARISKAVPAATFHSIENTVLRPTDQQQVRIPFLGADATSIVCHFNTTKSPYRIRAVLLDKAWTAGVFNDDGSLAYFATAMPGRPTKIDLKIVPDAERFQGVTAQALGKASRGPPPITVVARKGFVTIRAPDRGQSYQRERDEVLAQADCTEMIKPKEKPAATSSTPSIAVPIRRDRIIKEP